MLAHLKTFGDRNYYQCEWVWQAHFKHVIIIITQLFSFVHLAWYKLYPYSGRHFNTAGPSDFLKVNFQTPQIKRKLFCYRLYSIVDNCKIRGHFNTPWPCDRSISTCLRDSERRKEIPLPLLSSPPPNLSPAPHDSELHHLVHKACKYLREGLVT